MANNLNNPELTIKTKVQNEILMHTKNALNARNAKKIIHDLGAGYSEITYKIVGAENVSYEFNMADYEKIVRGVVILINDKKRGVIKENFTDEKFIKQMYDLFADKEKQMLQNEKDKQHTHFIELLKNHLK